MRPARQARWRGALFVKVPRLLTDQPWVFQQVARTAVFEVRGSSPNSQSKAAGPKNAGLRYQLPLALTTGRWPQHGALR